MDKHVCQQCDSYLEVSSTHYLAGRDERIWQQIEIIFGGEYIAEIDYLIASQKSVHLLLGRWLKIPKN